MASRQRPQHGGARRTTGQATASRPAPLVTPPAEAPLRHAVERRSALWLLYLARLPRIVVAAVAAAVLLVGVLAPGPAGGVALLVLAAALGLLAFVTWHAVRDSGRLLRALVIAGLVAWGVVKVLG